MDYQAFKAKTARANTLREVDVLGSFDFYTAIVSLDSLEARHMADVQDAFGGKDDALISRSMTPQQYQGLAKVLPLVAHEYTHFLDCTSTLWGLQHLRLMNKAYLSDDRRGGVEAQYAAAKGFHDHVRRLRLPKYYTVVDERARDERPWRSDISIGRVFDSSGSLSARPVLFARFSSYSGNLIARSPMSTISLLEASAMAQELLFHAQLLESTAGDFAKIEAKHFSDRQLEFLYNRELTEYSVCVHRTAIQQGCSDALSAFRVCAVLVRLALNCPESVFADLAENLPSGEFKSDPRAAEFGEALRAGLRLRDRGIFFYLLNGALPDGSFKDSLSLRNGLDVALKHLRTDMASFREQAIAEARDLVIEVVASPIRPIGLLSMAGLENMERIAFDNPFLRFNGLHLLPALLGDSTTLSPFGKADNMLASQNLDTWFDELYEGQRWVERFSEACV